MASTKKVLAAIKSEVLDKKASPVVKNTVQHFGAKLVGEIGGVDPFNISSLATRQFLKKFSAEKIVGINNSTKSRVRTLLTRMESEGASTKKIAAALTEQFDAFSAGRSFVIARTEIAGASNFGAFEGMVQAGVEQKEWLATDDGDVRESHQALDGQIVNVDEPFVTEDGEEAMFPGDFGVPEEDINCRCGVLPVINDKSMPSFTMRLKSLERERAPFDRKLKKAFSSGFKQQKAAVLAALQE